MKIDPRIDKVLIDEQQLQAGILKAAAYIDQTYKNATKPPILVGILKGCIPFIGQLLFKINVDVELDFFAASSYKGGMQSVGKVDIITDIKNDVKDRDIILVEDIVDTGRTIKTITEILKDRQPKSLKVITLLDKPSQRVVDLKIDYVCFEIPNEFVVGFGLDYDEILRNLPYIGTLKEEVYKK